MKKIYSFALSTLVALTSSISAFALDNYTMGNYTLSPADGATVKTIEKVVVRFSGLADGIDAHILSTSVADYISITGDDGAKYTPTSFKAGTGASIDDLELTFDPIAKAGTYTLSIAEGVVMDYDQAETHGENEGYSINGPISATYTIAATSMNVWTIDPVSGSELTSIKDIKVDFPNAAAKEGIDEYSNAKNNITLTCGETVYHPKEAKIEGSDYSTAHLVFEEITTPGKYVLFIPAEVYKEYDSYENEAVNPDIYAFYTIQATTAAQITTAETSETYTVYDLFGRCVLNNASAGAMSDLNAGIYIVNGRKALIVK